MTHYRSNGHHALIALWVVIEQIEYSTTRVCWFSKSINIVTLHVMEKDVRAHHSIVRRPDLEEFSSLSIIRTDGVLVIHVQSLLMVYHPQRILEIPVLEVFNVSTVVDVKLNYDFTSIWTSNIQVCGLSMMAHD